MAWVAELGPAEERANVDAGHSRWEVERHALGDKTAPVPAVHDVALVPETRHEAMHDHADLHHA